MRNIWSNTLIIYIKYFINQILLLKSIYFNLKMKKGKVNQPKRIKVCLDIFSQEYDLSFNPSNPNRKYSSKNINELSSQSQSIQRKCRFSTKGKTSICQPNEGVIRLKSKKKRNSVMLKQNIKSQALKTQQQKKLFRSSSIQKYFQSHKKPLSNSTQFLLNKKAPNPESQEASPSHWQIKISTAKNLQVNRRKLSQSRSMKTLLEQHNSLVTKSCSLNKKIRSNADDEKLKSRLERIKQFKFVSQYLGDLELEGLFNQFDIAGIPEARWPILIVDRVFEIIRKQDNNDYSHQVIRKF